MHFNYAIFGFRFFLTILICVYHFYFNFISYNIWFIEKFYLAVDSFFLLSGFLIASMSTRYDQKFIFLKSRLDKLIPLHWLCITIVFCIYIARYFLIYIAGIDVSAPKSIFIEPNTLPNLIKDYFLLGGLGLTHTITWNYPSWSISTEIWLYVLYCIFMWHGKNRLLVSFFILAITGALLSFQPDLNLTTLNDGNGYILQPLIRGLFGFSAGVLTFDILRQDSFKLEKILFIFILTLIAAFNIDVFVHIFTVFFILLTKNLNIEASRIFIKNSSFAVIIIYLVHAPAIMILDILNRRVFQEDLTLNIVAIFFCIILSIMSYIVFIIHNKFLDRNKF